MSDDLKWVSTTNMFVLNEDKVLVMKRSDNLESFPGWYILPGGKHESHETPKEAAIRETFEETGIKVVDPKLRIFATHLHDYKNKVYLVYIFEAKKFSGKLKNSKEGEAMWVNIKELLKSTKLYPDLKRHIQMILDNQKSDVMFTYHRFSEDLKILEER